MTDEIITGERIQFVADIYIGKKQHFCSNPNIGISPKCLDILSITAPFNNPYIIFLYPDVLYLLPHIIVFFNNPFILVTHNSDINIKFNISNLFILEYPKVIRWFAQNVCFTHSKLHPLPIGIANSQWKHGNLSIFNTVSCNSKENNIYMNFSIETSPLIRNECKRICTSKGITFLDTVSFEEHIHRLSKYKYCICPEGNGVDTHRLWECLYVKTIPIMLKTNFSEIILRYYNLPIILLDSWNSLDINSLNYTMFENKWNLSSIIKEIRDLK